MADEFKLGKAIWHNKDYDMPIDIVGKEVIDGRIYAKIKGSSTGISLDEVVYDNKPKMKSINIDRLEKKRSHFETMIKSSTASPGEKANAQSMLDRLDTAKRENLVSMPNKKDTLRTTTNNPKTKKAKKKTTTKAIQNLVDTDAVRQMKKWKFTRVAAIGTAAVVGTGTILHMANNRSNKKRAEEQVEEQERNQRRRERRARKYMYAGTGYKPETFNGFVQDMFNQRSGHHKMGNAKFK